MPRKRSYAVVKKTEKTELTPEHKAAHEKSIQAMKEAMSRCTYNPETNPVYQDFKRKMEAIKVEKPKRRGFRITIEWF